MSREENTSVIELDESAIGGMDGLVIGLYCFLFYKMNDRLVCVS